MTLVDFLVIVGVSFLTVLLTFGTIFGLAWLLNKLLVRREE